MSNTQSKLELQLKHIDIVQDVIKRMAQNSFVIRGWSITLVSVMFAILKTQNVSPFSFLLAIIPAFIFWYLDALYLRNERLFRDLYADIVNDINRTPEEANKVTPLSMSIKNYGGNCSVLDTMVSSTVLAIPFAVITCSIGLTVLHAR